MGERGAAWSVRTNGRRSEQQALERAPDTPCGKESAVGASLGAQARSSTLSMAWSSLRRPRSSLTLAAIFSTAEMTVV
jgi:hypothetical protein